MSKKVFINEKQLRKIVREFITTGAVAGYTAPLAGNMNPDPEKDAIRFGGIDPEDMKELVGISYEDIEDEIISPEERNKKNLNMINRRKVRNAGVGIISAYKRNVTESKGTQPPGQPGTYSTVKPLSVKQFTTKFKSDLKVNTKEVSEISAILDTYEKARKGELGRTPVDNDISNLEQKLKIFMKSYIKTYADFIKMNSLYKEFNISSGIDRNKFFRLLSHDEIIFQQQTLNQNRGRGRPKKGEVVEKPKEFISFDQLFKVRFHKTIKAAFEEIGDELLKITPKIKIHEKTKESKNEEGENIQRIANEMELSVGGAHDIIKRALARVFIHSRITSILVELEGDVQRMRSDIEREIESISRELYGESQIQQKDILNTAKQDIIDISSQENMSRILSMPRSEERTNEIQSEMSLLNLNLNYFSSVSNDLDSVEFYNEIVNIVLGQDDIEVIYEFLRTTNNETILDEIINNSKEQFILNLDHKINELTKQAELSIEKRTAATKSLEDKEKIDRYSGSLNRDKLELTTILKKYRLSTLNLTEIDENIFKVSSDNTPNVIPVLISKFKISKQDAENIQKKVKFINFYGDKIREIELKYVDTDLSSQLDKKIEILERKKSSVNKYFIEMKASCADNPNVASDQMRVEKLLQNYEENFKSHIVLYEFIGKRTREIDIIKGFLLSLASYNSAADIRTGQSAVKNEIKIYIAEDILIENQNLRNRSATFFGIFKDIEFIKAFLTTHVSHTNVIDKFIDLLEFAITNENFDFEDKTRFNEFLRIIATIIKNVQDDEFNSRIIKNVLLEYLKNVNPTQEEINSEFNALITNNTFNLEDVKLMRNILITNYGGNQYDLESELPIFKYLNGILRSVKDKELTALAISQVDNLSREERIELLKQRRKAQLSSTQKAKEYFEDPEFKSGFTSRLNQQILDDYLRLIKSKKLNIERFKDNLILADHEFDQQTFISKMSELLNGNHITQSQYNDLIGLNQSLSNPLLRKALKKSIKKTKFVKQPKTKK